MIIIKGTTSLIKNTLSGTFQSIHKITDSVSSGISLLSMDDEYLERRRIFMLQAPKHLIDGLGQGCVSIANGLTEGICGIVEQPIIGQKNEGFIGIIKGTAKGISGLIVKPISGILDASAKTAQSITVTANYFDDKPYNQRIRYPRVLYERSRYFLGYNEYDARVVFKLQEFLKGKYSQIDYISSYESRNLKELLVISYQIIICINQKEDTVIEQFNPRQYFTFHKDKEQIKIQQGQRCYNFTPFQSQMDNMMEKLQYILDQEINENNIL